MASLVAGTMGTTVSVDVRDPRVDPRLLDEVVATLARLDGRFSTYREDSEVSRIDRGELSSEDAHDDVRSVLEACAVLRAETAGAFDAFRGGHLDPSGYVKGWAAERGADVLRRAGVRSFAINLGGDVVCAGGTAPGTPWRVGVRGPDAADRIILVLGVRDGGVATSGLYERAGHVADARTGAVQSVWQSITVLASDLTTADSIATAALAMGARGPEWAASRFGCHVAAVDAAGSLWTTPGLEAARVA